jgi:hypothetical protein
MAGLPRKSRVPGVVGQQRGSLNEPAWGHQVGI